MPTTDIIEISDLDKLDFKYWGHDSNISPMHYSLKVNMWEVEFIGTVQNCRITDHNGHHIDMFTPTLQHLLNLIKVLKGEL